jgi:hypothetical protein
MGSAVADAPPSQLSGQRSDVCQGAPFSNVEQGIAFIGSPGPEGRSSRRLRREVEWFVAQQRALEALSACWLAEIDRLDEIRHEEQAADDPFLLAPSRWLQETLNVTPNAAYAQIHTARQLQHLKRTVDALRRGEISSQQVSVICRATEESRKTSLELSDVEAELVDAARRMDHVELRRHWCQMRYQADQAAAEEAEEEQRRRRWVRFWKTPLDTYRIEGELDPESGAVLKTAFKAMLARAPKDDERTADERRADVLMDMGRRCLDAGDLPERGAERPHLTVVAELSTLRLEPGSAMARLDWGPLLTRKASGRPPGRRPGEQHGRHAHRQAPVSVDEGVGAHSVEDARIANDVEDAVKRRCVASISLPLCARAERGRVRRSRDSPIRRSGGRVA